MAPPTASLAGLTLAKEEEHHAQEYHSSAVQGPRVDTRQPGYACVLATQLRPGSLRGEAPALLLLLVCGSQGFTLMPGSCPTPDTVVVTRVLSLKPVEDRRGKPVARTRVMRRPWGHCSRREGGQSPG